MFNLYQIGNKFGLNLIKNSKIEQACSLPIGLINFYKRISFRTHFIYLRLDN